MQNLAKFLNCFAWKGPGEMACGVKKYRVSYCWKICEWDAFLVVILKDVGKDIKNTYLMKEMTDERDNNNNNNNNNNNIFIKGQAPTCYEIWIMALTSQNNVPGH